MNFRFITVLLLIILSVVFVRPVSAQNRMGITVSPFIIEEAVKAGQNFNKTIVLTNTSDEKQIFYSFLQDFTVKEESGEAVLLPAGSDEFSLSYWLDISSEKIELLPGESERFSVNFYIPEKASPGGYYAAIIFSSELPQFEAGRPAEGMFVGLAHQVGVLIFLNLSEGALEQADLIQFSTDKNYYHTPFRINFITRIKNEGNMHIRPAGLIKIENIFGREKAILPFNAEGYIILPQTIRRFEQIWQGDFAFGKYEAYLFFNFGTPPDKGGMGTQALFGQTSFWIIPWKMIIYVSLVSFFLIIVIYLLYKRYKKAYKKIYFNKEHKEKI